VAHREQNPKSSATQDYAKAIYSLQMRGHSSVSTTAIAERVHVLGGALAEAMRVEADA
jgi:Mn-dependent DtxR family transcriptional regulator